MKTIPQVSLMAVAALGISKPSGFDGTFSTFGLLDPNDRIRVTNWVSAYVKNNPNEFSPATVDVATRPDGSAVQIDELEEYDVIDQISDFTEEVGNQAVEVIGEPLANIGKSVSYLTNWLPIVGLVAAYFFFIKKTS